MTDFSDLQLDRSEAEDDAPRSRPPQGGPPDGQRFVAGALVVLALAAIGAYLLWPRRPASAPVQKPVNAAAPAARTRSLVEPAADIPVPPLDESDALVRQLVSQLSQHPNVLAWLTTNHLIRNFAVVVQNMAGRELATKHLSAVRPSGAFAVVREGGKAYVDPASYRRYDAYADAFAAMDARGAARLYATLKPRISEALRDLGDPAGDADGTLKRAIVQLLATPVIDSRIRLTQPTVMYVFEDPALESLSPVQRQLLRMGPRNTRIVQAKLREIAPYVGIDLSADASR